MCKILDEFRVISLATKVANLDFDLSLQGGSMTSREGERGVPACRSAWFGLVVPCLNVPMPRTQLNSAG